MYVKDPSKIDASKTSRGYKDLTNRIGNHDLQLKFTLLEKGASTTIEIDGVPTNISHGALSGGQGDDAGGFIAYQSDGSFAVVVAEGGYIPDVKASLNPVGK